MIKRYSKGIQMLLDDKGEWCKHSDVEQLEQERDQLAARVERLIDMLEQSSETATDCNLNVLAGMIEERLNESPATSLELRDKRRDRELLLRLADEFVKEHSINILGAPDVDLWLRAKAEEPC